MSKNAGKNAGKGKEEKKDEEKKVKNTVAWLGGHPGNGFRPVQPDEQKYVHKQLYQFSRLNGGRVENIFLGTLGSAGPFWGEGDGAAAKPTLPYFTVVVGETNLDHVAEWQSKHRSTLCIAVTGETNHPIAALERASLMALLMRLVVTLIGAQDPVILDLGGSYSRYAEAHFGGQVHSKNPRFKTHPGPPHQNPKRSQCTCMCPNTCAQCDPLRATNVVAVHSLYFRGVRQEACRRLLVDGTPVHGVIDTDLTAGTRHGGQVRVENEFEPDGVTPTIVHVFTDGFQDVPRYTHPYWTVAENPRESYDLELTEAELANDHVQQAIMSGYATLAPPVVGQAANTHRVKTLVSYEVLFTSGDSAVVTMHLGHVQPGPCRKTAAPPVLATLYAVLDCVNGLDGGLLGEVYEADAREMILDCSKVSGQPTAVVQYAERVSNRITAARADDLTTAQLSVYASLLVAVWDRHVSTLASQRRSRQSQLVESQADWHAMKQHAPGSHALDVKMERARSCGNAVRALGASLRGEWHLCGLKEPFQSNTFWLLAMLFVAILGVMEDAVTVAIVYCLDPVDTHLGLVGVLAMAAIFTGLEEKHARKRDQKLAPPPGVGPRFAVHSVKAVLWWHAHTLWTSRAHGDESHTILATAVALTHLLYNVNAVSTTIRHRVDGDTLLADALAFDYTWFLRSLASVSFLTNPSGQQIPGYESTVDWALHGVNDVAVETMTTPRSIWDRVWPAHKSLGDAAALRTALDELARREVPEEIHVEPERRPGLGVVLEPAPAAVPKDLNLEQVPVTMTMEAAFQRPKSVRSGIRFVAGHFDSHIPRSAPKSFLSAITSRVLRASDVLYSQVASVVQPGRNLCEGVYHFGLRAIFATCAHARSFKNTVEPLLPFEEELASRNMSEVQRQALREGHDAPCADSERIGPANGFVKEEVSGHGAPKKARLVSAINPRQASYLICAVGALERWVAKAFSAASAYVAAPALDLFHLSFLHSEAVRTGCRVTVPDDGENWDATMGRAAQSFFGRMLVQFTDVSASIYGKIVSWTFSLPVTVRLGRLGASFTAYIEPSGRFDTTVSNTGRNLCLSAAALYRVIENWIERTLKRRAPANAGPTPEVAAHRAAVKETGERQFSTTKVLAAGDDSLIYLSPSMAGIMPSYEEWAALKGTGAGVKITGGYTPVTAAQFCSKVPWPTKPYISKYGLADVLWGPILGRALPKLGVSASQFALPRVVNDARNSLRALVPFYSHIPFLRVWVVGLAQALEKHATGPSGPVESEEERWRAKYYSTAAVGDGFAVETDEVSEARTWALMRVMYGPLDWKATEQRFRLVVERLLASGATYLTIPADESTWLELLVAGDKDACAYSSVAAAELANDQPVYGPALREAYMGLYHMQI